MAYFYDYEIGAGWWWYFELMVATARKEDEPFIQEFIEEIAALIAREGKPYGETRKVKKRIPMQRL